MPTLVICRVRESSRNNAFFRDAEPKDISSTARNIVLRTEAGEK